MSSIFIIHFAATWALAGLIWTVQLSLYPLFLRVGRESFPAYHAAHIRRITWIVAPLMFVELGTAVWLLVVEDNRNVFFLLSLLALGLNWISTALVQVPLHKTLERDGFDERLLGKLVLTNWTRTGAWSLRALLLVIALEM